NSNTKPRCNTSRFFFDCPLNKITLTGSLERKFPKANEGHVQRLIKVTVHPLIGIGNFCPLSPIPNGVRAPKFPCFPLWLEVEQGDFSWGVNSDQLKENCYKYE